jgi:hypothetical protein
LVITVNIYRLILISTGRKAIESFVTIGRWRNTGSKRIAYKTSLDTVADILLQDETATPTSAAQETPPSAQETTTTTTTRRTRSSQNSLASEAFPDILQGKTGGTPKRQKKNVYEAASEELSNAQRLAKKRLEKCVGWPVLVVNPEVEKDSTVDKTKGSNTRGACRICKARCSVYCLGCKEWYCFNWNNLKRVPEGPHILKLGRNTPQTSVLDRTHITCWNACFHRQHWSNYCAALSGDDDEQDAQLVHIVNGLASND